MKFVYFRCIEYHYFASRKAKDYEASLPIPISCYNNMSLSLWIFLALVGVLCKQISHEARTRQHPSTTGESFLHVNTILITWIMNDSLFGLYIEFKYSCIYMYLQLFYHTFLLLSSEFSSLKLLFVPIAKRSKRLVMMLQITWLTTWQSLDAALMGEHWPAANTGLRIEDRG